MVFYAQSVNQYGLYQGEKKRERVRETDSYIGVRRRRRRKSERDSGRRQPAKTTQQSAEKTLEEVSKLVFYAHSRRSSQVIVICHKKPTQKQTKSNKSNLTKHEIL